LLTVPRSLSVKYGNTSFLHAALDESRMATSIMILSLKLKRSSLSRHLTYNILCISTSYHILSQSVYVCATIFTNVYASIYCVGVYIIRPMYSAFEHWKRRYINPTIIIIIIVWLTEWLNNRKKEKMNKWIWMNSILCHSWHNLSFKWHNLLWLKIYYMSDVVIYRT
jgi:hypothetical protein